jgi:hypothetical protein
MADQETEKQLSDTEAAVRMADIVQEARRQLLVQLPEIQKNIDFERIVRDTLEKEIQSYVQVYWPRFIRNIIDGVLGQVDAQASFDRQLANTIEQKVGQVARDLSNWTISNKLEAETVAKVRVLINQAVAPEDLNKLIQEGIGKEIQSYIESGVNEVVKQSLGLIYNEVLRMKTDLEHLQRMYMQHSMHKIP